MQRLGGGGFGFPGVQSMAAKLALGLVVGSVLSLLAGSAGDLLLLFPSGVVSRLWLWQPFTYPFIERSPLGIIFGAMILYSIGGSLEGSWGPRRLLWVIWGGAVLAGILTTLLSLVVPLAGAYTGGWVMGTIAWVVHGLYIGRGQTNFWGIPVTGNVMALIGAGFVVLNGLTGGWASQIPELFALGIAFVYMRGGSPRHLWLRVQHWRLQRQLRGRSRHLRVISEERPESDKFLN
jgi:membrane associated rhomboid family serine protease